MLLAQEHKSYVASRRFDPYLLRCPLDKTHVQACRRVTNEHPAWCTFLMTKNTGCLIAPDPVLCHRGVRPGCLEARQPLAKPGRYLNY